MSRANAIRKEILMQLYVLRPLSVSVERIHRDTRKEGYDYALNEVKAEAAFLVSDGIAEAKDVPGVTGKFIGITAKGVRAYEENN